MTDVLDLETFAPKWQGIYGTHVQTPILQNPLVFKIGPDQRPTSCLMPTIF